MATYDLYGWYSAEQYPGREAPEPSNTSLTEIPGQLRANWTGHEWIDLPYVAPIVETMAAPVSFSITRAQAKLALLNAGLLDAVQQAIDAIQDPVQRAAMQIEWDDRLTFERENPTLNALAAAIGLTSEQVDDLFRVAVQL